MKKIFYFLVVFCLMTTTGYSQTLNDFNVLSSFCQGSANNCASVALIKAAMAKYGYNNIFTVQKSEGKFKIILRDGTKLTVTESENKLATEYSHFDTTGSYEKLGTDKDSVLFYAYLTYACIAKNIEENGYWSCSNNFGDKKHLRRIKGFENSLLFITRTSYCTDNCHLILGLKIKSDKIYDYTGQPELNDVGTILYSWGHAVATYKNQLDCHGDWPPVSANRVCYNNFKWFIILE